MPTCDTRGVWTSLGLALLCSGTLYFLFGDLNLDLADEGFLWYGTLRTRAGEVALRDFQSYDPGRYYWCVAWSFLFGEGILGLRAALAAAQAAGLFFGLLVCRRVFRHPLALAGCAAVLALWMFPRHKLFEPALSMAAVWVAVRLLEQPTARRLFEAGACAGLAAWFGRNHGVYSAAGFVLVIGLLLWRRQIPCSLRALRPFVVGGIAGSAPLWGMMLLVPGFAAALRDSVAFNLTKAVNLPLPYPFPWRFDLRGRHGLDLLAGLALMTAFVLPLVLYPVGMIVALRTPGPRLAGRAPVIGATLVGIFFLHHASVRSEILHLAQSIHPLLILMLAGPALLWPRRFVPGATIVAGVTFTVIVALNANQSVMHLWPRRPMAFVGHPVAGDTVRLPTWQAAYLSRIEAAVRSHVGPADSLFVAPTRPAFYPIFDKPSPVWWLYFLWPATELDQQRNLARLSGVQWALVVDETIDGRDDLRFRHSNPLIWEYLMTAFVAVPDSRLPPNYLLLRRRSP